MKISSNGERDEAQRHSGAEIQRLIYSSSSPQTIIAIGVCCEVSNVYSKWNVSFVNTLDRVETQSARNGQPGSWLQLERQGVCYTELIIGGLLPFSLYERTRPQ